MIILAQEDFSGLGTAIVAIHSVLLAIALTSLFFSTRGRWYGPVMAAPGLLLSCITTAGILTAMNSQNSGQWNIAMTILIASPSVVGLISVFVWAIQKSNSNSDQR
jgi:hypothetical protein